MFLPFSHSSVIGNLVTVLNFKFWHSCGAAIRLLARHTAQGFSRNPLIVLNTNNIYIHWDEAKFTAGFWGWLQDSLILNFRGFSCPPPRALVDRAAARGTLASTPVFVLQKMVPFLSLSLSHSLPITPWFYSPEVFDTCLCTVASCNVKDLWLWFVIPLRGIVLSRNRILPNLSFTEIPSEAAPIAETKPYLPSACVAVAGVG